ncbi:MAG: hypothetical protein FJ241_11655 [Nitrospira sp.]|nr:hypothetical protein [Nitrospira sp.]
MPTIDYRLKDGQRVSGVTTIISQNLGWNKQQLMYWANQEGLAGRNHRDTSQKAADAGTIGHYLIDCHIKNRTPDVEQFKTSPEIISLAETCLLNFLEWSKGVNLRVHITEINLVSEIFQFGGTPDCIGYISDKLALLDWKTSSGVYEDMLIQLAAYRMLWEENNIKMSLDGGFHLLRISKEEAAFHHHHWHSLSDAWEAFKAALELHKLHKILKKKL